MDPEFSRQGLTELALKDDLRARIRGIRDLRAAVMALEMSCYMRNQLLRDADWAGMAHSLEVRVPLVDVELLRRRLPLAVHRIPLDWRRLLQAAAPQVAAAVGCRPKSGFTVPVQECVSGSGASATHERGLRPWAKRVGKRFAGRPTQATRLDGRSKRVLVFRYGQLGDLLVALPALKAIRNRFADAHISLLCDRHRGTGWVSADQVLPAGMVDEILLYPANAGGLRPTTALLLLWRLRAKRFDTLVYLAPRLRSPSAVRRDLIFFRLAGITEVFGHQGFSAPAKPRMGTPLPMERHEADHLLDRLRVHGIHIETDRCAYDLELTEAERAEAEAFLRRNGGFDNGRMLVAIAPGTKWASKKWPEDRFAELGARLCRSHEVLPVILGGSDDQELGARLISHWGKGINAAGKLAVRLSVAVIERCRLYVGNDTGVMHLAAAAGVPCVAIFSAQDWPGRWYPYGSGHVVFRKQVPCEGCKAIRCPRGTLECLTAISVDEVFEACELKLADGKAGAERSRGAESV